MPKTSRQPTALSGLAEYRRHYSSGLDARTAFRVETWSTVAVGMEARWDITVALELLIAVALRWLDCFEIGHPG